MIETREMEENKHGNMILAVEMETEKEERTYKPAEYARRSPVFR